MKKPGASSSDQAPGMFRASSHRELDRRATEVGLLLLLVVHRVAAEPRRILLDLQLLASRLATEGVVVIAGFFANQKHGLSLLLALGHRPTSISAYE